MLFFLRLRFAAYQTHGAGESEIDPRVGIRVDPRVPPRERPRDRPRQRPRGWLKHRKSLLVWMQGQGRGESCGDLVAPYCAIPRDYLSDTPVLRAMGFLVSQHSELGAIPPPPCLSVSPFESIRTSSGGAIPPPLKRGISAILLRYPMKNKANGCDTPSAIRSRKGIAGISHWAAKCGDGSMILAFGCQRGLSYVCFLWASKERIGIPRPTPDRARIPISWKRSFNSGSKNPHFPSSWRMEFSVKKPLFSAREHRENGDFLTENSLLRPV